MGGLLQDNLDNYGEQKQEESEAKQNGNCWCCVYGKPYYGNYCKSSSKENSKLTVCMIGKQGNKTIATVQNKECKHWKQKGNN